MDNAAVQPDPEAVPALPSPEQFRTTAASIKLGTVGSELELKLFGGEKCVELVGGIERFNSYSSREKEILEKLSEEIVRIDCHSWSYQSLHGAGRLFEQQSHFGDLRRLWPGLEYSYFRTVQGLDWEKQRELLNETCRNGWKVKDLVEKVASDRSKGRNPKEPKPASEAVRKLRLASNALDARDELAKALAEASVDPQEVAEIVEMMTTLDSRLDALRERLSSRKIG